MIVKFESLFVQLKIFEKKKLDEELKTDEEIQQMVWKGEVPIMFVLAPNEVIVPQAPPPYYVFFFFEIFC